MPNEPEPRRGDRTARVSVAPPGLHSFSRRVPGVAPAAQASPLAPIGRPLRGLKTRYRAGGACAPPRVAKGGEPSRSRAVVREVRERHPLGYGTVTVVLPPGFMSTTAVPSGQVTVTRS